MSNTNFITLGKIGRTYGIKGWFHVNTFTEDPVGIFSHSKWYLKEATQWQPVDLEAHRSHGGGFIAKIKGYDTPEATRLLTNREIGIPETELPELSENEYYWTELVGLDVYTLQQIYLGKVSELLATGANDVLCVQGERERLIPYIDSVIKEVDLTQKRIIVDWDAEF